MTGSRSHHSAYARRRTRPIPINRWHRGQELASTKSQQKNDGSTCTEANRTAGHFFLTKPVSKTRETRGLFLPNDRLAAARAADANRDLLALDTTNTAGHCVRHLARYTSSYFDSLLLAYWTAYGVADGLGALLRNHAAYFVAASFGLRNHAAYFVADGLSALLRNHTAYFVAASFGLRNHAAYFVADGLGALLRNHTAHFVAASFGLRNHAAYFVAAGTSSLLAYRAAHFVAAGFWSQEPCGILCSKPFECVVRKPFCSS